MGLEFRQLGYCSVGFYYTPEKNAPLIFYVNTVPLQSSHTLLWTDVTGPSDLRVRQTAEITLYISGTYPTEEVDRALEVHDYIEAYGDAGEESELPPGVFTIQQLLPDSTQTAGEFGMSTGEPVYVEFISDRVFRRGTPPVWVQIGCRTTNHVFADALYFESAVNYRWFIPRVGVDSYVP